MDSGAPARWPRCRRLPHLLAITALVVCGALPMRAGAEQSAAANDAEEGNERSSRRAGPPLTLTTRGKEQTELVHEYLRRQRASQDTTDLFCNPHMARTIENVGDWSIIKRQQLEHRGLYTVRVEAAQNGGVDAEWRIVLNVRPDDQYCIQLANAEEPDGADGDHSR